MKNKKKEVQVPAAFSMYRKTILEAPSRKSVNVYTFPTKTAAEEKQKRLKSWPFTKIVQARDGNGKFDTGVALVCCK